MDVRGGRLSAGPGFVLLLAAAVFFLGPAEAAMIAAAAAIHEAGHAAAVALAGGRIGSLKAGVSGLSMTYSPARPSYACDAALAAAGPAASLFAAAASAAAARSFGTGDADFFAGVNLIFCLFNMLPASALDGGDVLYAAVSSALGPFAAERCRAFADWAVCLGLFAAGMLAFLRRSFNPSLLICAAVIFDRCCKIRDDGVKSERNFWSKERS